jgi:hypothetical protein
MHWMNRFAGNSAIYCFTEQSIVAWSHHLFLLTLIASTLKCAFCTSLVKFESGIRVRHGRPPFSK